MNKVILGNNKEVLKTFADNSIDSIVTDPPYELGFMGKKWDNTGIAYDVELWQECLRVLKPGGHLLAFSGTRTYHRMAVAIEDAGFEVRDMIEWVYGSGFPKSLNVGKAVDKLQGNEREDLGEHDGRSKYDSCKRKEHINRPEQFDIGKSRIIKTTRGTSPYEGLGTALKPAHEPICMARKPLSEKNVALNVLKWGTGGIDIDGSRVEGELTYSSGKPSMTKENGWNDNSMTSMPERTVTGRFPSNLIHDGSDEVKACFPESKGIEKRTKIKAVKGKGKADTCYGDYGVNLHDTPSYEGGGNTSRFFKSIIYQAKASKSERNRGCEGLPLVENSNGDKWSDIDRRDGKIPVLRHNNHPTVKPIALMAYLIKMVTPKGGVVLDPFAGSGSTLVAAKEEGFQYVGIDITPEYIEIINARLAAVTPQQKLF